MTNDPYTGEHNATEFAVACLQSPFVPTIPDDLDPQAKALLQAATSGVTTASDDCKYFVCFIGKKEPDSLALKACTSMSLGHLIRQQIRSSPSLLCVQFFLMSSAISVLIRPCSGSMEVRILSYYVVTADESL